MSDFDAWWQAYPKKTGIGAARRAYSNQIFFHEGDQAKMLHGAQKYAEKDMDEKFRQNPARFLEDQTYLDPAYQEPLTGETLGNLSSWQQRLADHLGEKAYLAWCAGAEFSDGVLKITKPRMAGIFQNMFATQLKLAGVREVV